MLGLTKKQLEGLNEVLPAGYPRTGGVVVATSKGKKGGSRKGRRRYDGVKRSLFIPWYRPFVQ